MAVARQLPVSCLNCLQGGHSTKLFTQLVRLAFTMSFSHFSPKLFTYTVESSRIARQTAMGKGAKWAAREDEALASAWVAVSDPTSGVTISSDEFWEAVYAKWLAQREGDGPARSEKAIKTRWQVLTHTVQRFEALLALAQEANPGEARDVLFDAANRDFLREEGVLFDRRQVWAILTGCSRWSSNPRSLRKLMRMRKAAVLREDVPGAVAKRRKSADDDLELMDGSSTSAADAAGDRDPQRLGRLAPAPRSRDAVGPIGAFANSLQRLNEREHEAVDVLEEHTASIAAVGRSAMASAMASISSTSTESVDAYAAAVADLARAQREKNELVADQMLMTMLLADSMDMRNRAALEQLKMKYMQRAFALENRQQQQQQQPQ